MAALDFPKQCVNQIQIFSIIVEFSKMFLLQNQLENHQINFETIESVSGQLKASL